MVFDKQNIAGYLFLVACLFWIDPKLVAEDMEAIKDRRVGWRSGSEARVRVVSTVALRCLDVRLSSVLPPARLSVWVSARDSFPPLGSSPSLAPSLRPSPVPSPAPPSPIWGPRAAEKQRGGWEGGREAVTTPLEPFPLLLLLLPHACVTDKKRNREREQTSERAK